MTAVELTNVFATFEQAYGIALADIPLPGPWAKKGRCRTAPTEIFFPTRGDNAQHAKRICSRCPVQEPCRRYALDHLGLQGVWGGLTAIERQAVRDQPAVPEPDEEPEREPRAAASPPGELYRKLEELAEHPGRWARIGHWESSHSAAATASMLRTHRRPTPPGAWTFEARVNPAGGSDLYALHGPQPTRQEHTVNTDSTAREASTPDAWITRQIHHTHRDRRPDRRTRRG